MTKVAKTMLNALPRLKYTTAMASTLLQTFPGTAKATLYNALNGGSTTLLALTVRCAARLLGATEDSAKALYTPDELRAKIDLMTYAELTRELRAAAPQTNDGQADNPGSPA